MQTLQDSIQQYAQDGGSPEKLRLAAQEWSSYSLKTFDKKLLNKALKISSAIANFLNEMERTQ